jgi:hypothetical protein
LKVAAEGEGEDEKKRGDGKPEGAVADAGSEERAADRAGYEDDDDQTEIAELEEGLSALVAMERGVEGFDGGAEIAGDEGGVVGVLVDGAEAGDLIGGNDADERNEEEVGEVFGEEGGGEEDDDLQGEADEDAVAAGVALECLLSPDAGDEGGDGEEMMKGFVMVVAEESDAGEDGVAGHGTGEDLAVIEVEEGVEGAAGEGEEKGGGERVGGAALGCGVSGRPGIHRGHADVWFDAGR